MRNRRFVKPRGEEEEQGQKDEEEQDENKEISDVSAHAKVQPEQTQVVLRSEPVQGSVPRKAVRLSHEGRPGLGAGGAGGAEAVHTEQEVPARAKRRTYREALCGDQTQLGHNMVTRSKAK